MSSRLIAKYKARIVHAKRSIVINEKKIAMLKTKKKR